MYCTSSHDIGKKLPGGSWNCSLMVPVIDGIPIPLEKDIPVMGSKPRSVSSEPTAPE